MRAYFAVFGASILAAVACGARTGLPVPGDIGDGVYNPDGSDAGDASDAQTIRDASPDVIVELACVDAGIQFIYTITEENELYSFYPPSNAFTDLGPIACPVTDMATPFSMGVTRSGLAYSIFSDGNLFSFDTGKPSTTCQATPYAPTTLGNTNRFGMAFSADVNDPGEKLYIASGDPTDGGAMNPEFLGTIDVNAFQLDPIGQFPQIIGSAELTGTGDGRLFGFGVDQVTTGTGVVTATFQLLEFDKTNASLISDIPLELPTGNAGIEAWAFSYYGGKFYFFTAVNNQSFSRVSVYAPQPGDTVATATEILQLGNLIVGAGVSTCAPMQ